MPGKNSASNWQNQLQKKWELKSLMKTVEPKRARRENVEKSQKLHCKECKNRSIDACISIIHLFRFRSKGIITMSSTHSWIPDVLDDCWIERACRITANRFIVCSTFSPLSRRSAHWAAQMDKVKQPWRSSMNTLAKLTNEKQFRPFPPSGRASFFIATDFVCTEQQNAPAIMGASRYS